MQKNPTPADGQATKTSPGYRPNLSQSIYIGNEDERILSSLKLPSDAAGQHAAAPKKSLFKFAAFTLLGAVLAFVGYQTLTNQPKEGTPSTELATAGNTGSGKKPTAMVEQKAQPGDFAAMPAATPAPTAVAEASSAMTADPAAGAAQIVNEPAAAKAPVASKAKLTEALEDGVKPPKAALQKALEGKSSASSTAGATAAVAAGAAPKAASPAVTRAAPTPATTATQKNLTSEADKDINLIAALLAHNSAATSTPFAKPSFAAAEAKKPVAVAVASAPASASTDKSTLAAAPVAGFTEVALKQCAELGFIEREVCRVKTCNNQWDTNPACKATLSSAK